MYISTSSAASKSEKAVKNESVIFIKNSKSPRGTYYSYDEFVALESRKQFELVLQPGNDCTLLIGGKPFLCLDIGSKIVSYYAFESNVNNELLSEALGNDIDEKYKFQRYEAYKFQYVEKEQYVEQGKRVKVYKKGSAPVINFIRSIATYITEMPNNYTRTRTDEEIKNEYMMG